jgi:hypothetical protein
LPPFHRHTLSRNEKISTRRGIGKKGVRMSWLLAEAFRRDDEMLDELFYRTPRFVAHLNAPNYKTG